MDENADGDVLDASAQEARGVEVSGQREVHRHSGQRPKVVLSPTVPVKAAGTRIEPPASLPNARMQEPLGHRDARSGA